MLFMLFFYFIFYILTVQSRCSSFCTQLTDLPNRFRMEFGYWKFSNEWCILKERNGPTHRFILVYGKSAGRWVCRFFFFFLTLRTVAVGIIGDISHILSQRTWRCPIMSSYMRHFLREREKLWPFYSKPICVSSLRLFVPVLDVDRLTVQGWT